jgi:hypothetical protein
MRSHLSRGRASEGAIDERIHLLSKFAGWGQPERWCIKDAFERVAAVSYGLSPIGGCKMVTGLANERESRRICKGRARTGPGVTVGRIGSRIDLPCLPK